MEGCCQKPRHKTYPLAKKSIDYAQNLLDQKRKSDIPLNLKKELQARKERKEKLEK